jgi:hypothetical protein
MRLDWEKAVRLAADHGLDEDHLEREADAIVGLKLMHEREKFE